jgi:hypothetical protein
MSVEGGPALERTTKSLLRGMRARQGSSTQKTNNSVDHPPRPHPFLALHGLTLSARRPSWEGSIPELHKHRINPKQSTWITWGARGLHLADTLARTREFGL